MKNIKIEIAALVASVAFLGMSIHWSVKRHEPGMLWLGVVSVIAMIIVIREIVLAKRRGEI